MVREAGMVEKSIQDWPKQDIDRNEEEITN